MSQKHRLPIKSNILAHAKMVAALMHEACSLAELEEESGLHQRSISNHVRALRKEGACYIAEWRQVASGQYNLPAYRLGTGRDAKKPLISVAERSKAKRARKAMIRAIEALRGEALTT